MRTYEGDGGDKVRKKTIQTSQRPLEPEKNKDGEVLNQAEVPEGAIVEAWTSVTTCIFISSPRELRRAMSLQLHANSRAGASIVLQYHVNTG